ncbi:MAG: ABC transporter ATP-binding protein [Alteraurantiacibacter sp.]
MIALKESLRTARFILASLPPRRKRQAYLLLPILLLGALADMATIGLAIPFISLLVDSSQLSRVPFVMESLAAFGQETEREIAIAITVAFATTVLFSAVLRIAIEFYSKRVVFRIGHDLSVAVVRRILSQPYSFHVKSNSSETLAATNKTQILTQQFLLSYLDVINGVIVSLGILTALLIVNWQIAALIGLTIGLVYILIGLATRKRLLSIRTVIATAQKERVQYLQESIGAIRDVILDRRTDEHVKRFGTVESRFRDAQAFVRILSITPRYVVEGVTLLLISGLALSILLSGDDFVSLVPILAAFAIGAQRLLPTLQQINAAVTKIKASGQVVDDIRVMLQLPLHARPKGDAAAVPFRRLIAFENVGFRYDSDGETVLSKIDLIIPKGSRIGLIGSTGSGKSTLIDLLMGLLTPSTGTLSIDGYVLTESNVADWQAHIAHVPQFVFLADATLRQNIAFSADDASIDMERVLHAARLAGVDDFASELPDGYDTMMGERGVRFSGGQRQRIGIARALYQTRDLLVLDEATSALDSATEAQIMENLDTVGRDTTMVMIAHRLETLRVCDTIIRLEKGRISGIGTYDEIIGALQTAAGGATR